MRPDPGSAKTTGATVLSKALESKERCAAGRGTVYLRPWYSNEGQESNVLAPHETPGGADHRRGEIN